MLGEYLKFDQIQQFKLIFITVQKQAAQLNDGYFLPQEYANP